MKYLVTLAILLFALIVVACTSCTKQLQNINVDIDVEIVKDSIRVAISPGVDAIQEMWIAKITASQPLTTNTYVSFTWDVYGGKNVPVFIQQFAYVAVYEANMPITQYISTYYRTPDSRVLNVFATNVHILTVSSTNTNYLFHW